MAACISPQQTQTKTQIYKQPKQKITLKLSPESELSVKKNGLLYLYTGEFTDNCGNTYYLRNASIFENGWVSWTYGYQVTDASEIPIDKNGKIKVETIGEKYGLLYTKRGKIPALVLQFEVI